MFAKSGQVEAPELTNREPDSDFEIVVAEILGQKGYEVVPQLGVAGFFIDIGVRNPERQGEFLAGIECDGATYHSGLSARDRDRLRQQVLEGLGWKGKIYRIWSIDWFKDPRQQTRRLLDFLEHLQEKAKSRTTEAALKASTAEFDVNTPSKQEHLPIEPKAVLLETVSLNEFIVVNIWDYVTYCDVEHPEDHKAVQIVEGHTDTEKGVIGENTPLARTLLGAEVGDEVELSVPGRTKRHLRVLKIER
jgi:very-short-patch-repair endonuclease